MAKEIEVSTASRADLAADMEYHRAMLGYFVRIIMYSVGAIAFVLLLLLLTLN